jgi:hypothetical protein
MSNYVTLVNLLLTRLNEVTLDPLGDGFDSTRGVQTLAKNAVNNSLNLIYQDAQEWPFLKTTQVQTLTSGTREYAYPSNYSSADIETFYLKKSTALNTQAKHLPVIGYEEYTQNYRPEDDENAGNVPERVYQTYENKFGVSPTPNGAYEVEYVYWSIPTALVLYSDACVVPSRFDHTIIDGAMMYMMRFRSNDQSAEIHQRNFENGIRAMRRVLLDDPTHIRSTVIRGRG